MLLVYLASVAIQAQELADSQVSAVLLVNKALQVIQVLVVSQALSVSQVCLASQVSQVSQVLLVNLDCLAIQGSVVSVHLDIAAIQAFQDSAVSQAGQVRQVRQVLASTSKDRSLMLAIFLRLVINPMTLTLLQHQDIYMSGMVQHGLT